MRRRTFIASSCVALIAVGAWRYRSGSDAAAIAMVIRKRLDYLKLDEAGVIAYANDLAAKHAIAGTRLHILNAIAPLYKHYSISAADNQLANTMRHGEDRIVSSYLIGSDFFINGADESRVVHYLGLPDSLRACSNPFARPANYPPDSA